MSQDDIDRLVSDRRLVHESFDDRQIAGFWSKATSAFADAQVAGLSTDTAFQTAYRACLQATLAVLASVCQFSANGSRTRIRLSGTCSLFPRRCQRRSCDMTVRCLPSTRRFCRRGSRNCRWVSPRW